MVRLPLYFYLMVAGGSFLISLVLTPFVRRLAVAARLVAAPDDNRWHKKETALLGGIAIFVAMTLAWGIGAKAADWATYGQSCLPLVVSAAAIFGIGLTDDIVDMAPQHKLAGQIIISSFLMFFGLRLGWTQSETANLLLTILWLVGITNAFNLLDNMDGLAAGVAFIAGLFLFLYQSSNSISPAPTGQVLLLTAAYLGAVLGFLVFNFHPASIFMGDAGSLFLGFMLASLTVLGSPPYIRGESFSNLLWVIAVPILIFFIPILDTGFVSLMRKLSRRRISQGGKDHSSHRLAAIGFSEKKAVLVLYGFSIASGLIALGVSRLSGGTSFILSLFYSLFVLFFWIYLGKVKVYEENAIRPGQKSGGLTPVLVEITYKRRMLEVMLDSVLVAAAYYTAYLLRFEGDPGQNFSMFLKSLPVLIASQIFFFFVLRTYHGVWEQTDFSDLVEYVKAITAGTVSSILIILFIYRFQGFSRAVFVIYWVFLVVLISLSRLSFRLLDDSLRKRNQMGRPTLIYGAGRGGQMTMNEIEHNRDLGLALVGFIDDNPSIQHRKIKGYYVLGGLQDLEGIIRKHHVKEIIVSFKGNGVDRKKEVQALCMKLGNGIKVRRMEVNIN